MTLLNQMHAAWQAEITHTHDSGGEWLRPNARDYADAATVFAREPA